MTKRLMLLPATLAVVLLSQAATAQTRKKDIRTLRWGKATLLITAASDSAVHVTAIEGYQASAVSERVDDLREWLDSTETVSISRPVVQHGEYLEVEGPLGGLGQMLRTAYSDSSRYLLAFNGPEQLYLTLSRVQLLALISALRVADTSARRMSGLDRDWRGMREADIDLSKKVTDEADFSGKGVAGGTSKGVAGGTAPVNTDQPYFEFQVEKQVTTAPGSPSPRYPDMLKSANVEGEVLAQFVVDTTGRADMSTFKVLKSSHELFTQSVRNVLPQMHFNAAEIGGRKVRQIMQYPFTFSLTR